MNPRDLMVLGLMLALMVGGLLTKNPVARIFMCALFIMAAVYLLNVYGEVWFSNQQ
jgi:hypothetical protein